MNVPKLRFPEFRGAGEWEVSVLGESDISTFVKERISLQNLSINNYVSTENLLPDYEGVATASKLPPSGSFISFKVGDVLISNIRPYLKKVWSANKDGASSNDVVVIRAQPKISHLFLSFLLKNDDFIDYVMEGAKGVKMPRGDISLMKEYPVIFPNKEEQQKIADCLSSLDELVTAETQKLAALKDHKKGLMQQLFPQTGETTPRVRFAEFLGAVEWEEVELKKLGVLVSGLTYSPDDVADNGLLVLRSSNVQNGEIRLEDNVYVKPDIRGANLSKPNDILICVRNGSKALIGKNALIPEGMPLCTHGAFMTVFRSPSAKFIFQLFQTSVYQTQVDGDLGATINSINGGHFIKYKFYIPKAPEQQKIANCLSSLDELITAQTRKIDALKTHKKGLMQGLFPNLSEEVQP
jgi:type I restriction enzyme S subunit